MTLADIVGSIALWTGTLVGVLKLVDWLLSPRQKRRIASWAATVWIWLDEQRLGKFVSAVRSVRAQTVLSLVAHTIITLATLLFLGRVFLGWTGYVEIYIGTPRLHVFQVWVDVAAILLSMSLLSFFLHPRITAWIARASSVPQYFLRVSFAVLLSYLTTRLYISGLLWAGLPLGEGVIEGSKFLGPALFAPGTDADYGGRLSVVMIHAVTAILGAPLFIEALLLTIISVSSVCWILLVCLLSGLHVTAKFIVLRIAEHKDGPVLGLSALLVAIGAMLKVFAL
jgi:hypothetical protein